MIEQHQCLELTILMDKVPARCTRSLQNYTLTLYYILKDDAIVYSPSLNTSKLINATLSISENVSTFDIDIGHFDMQTEQTDPCI